MNFCRCGVGWHSTNTMVGIIWLSSEIRKSCPFMMVVNSTVLEFSWMPPYRGWYWHGRGWPIQGILRCDKEISRFVPRCLFSGQKWLMFSSPSNFKGGSSRKGGTVSTTLISRSRRREKSKFTVYIKVKHRARLSAAARRDLFARREINRCTFWCCWLHRSN